MQLPANSTSRKLPQGWLIFWDWAVLVIKPMNLFVQYMIYIAVLSIAYIDSLIIKMHFNYIGSFLKRDWTGRMHRFVTIMGINNNGVSWALSCYAQLILFSIK